jgi:hypothetical protein
MHNYSFTVSITQEKAHSSLGFWIHVTFLSIHGVQLKTND